MNIKGQIGIIAHPDKPEAVKFAAELSRWLAGKHRYSCEAIQNLGAIRPNYGLLIALSGDGFIMSASSKLVSLGSSTPILGINFGDQGFLTLADAKAGPGQESWEDVLARVIRGDFVVEERFVLKVVHKEETFVAVNDAVIRHPDGMVILKVEVDGQVHYEELAADGIIVCTPTGSPAYNRSAGGPVIMPTIDCFAVTPLNPMAFHGNPPGIPLVAAPRSEVRITLVAKKPGKGKFHPNLKKDGQLCSDVHVGDCIIISASELRSRRVSFGPESFFKALRSKAGVRG